jgi:hypothetical protein
MQFAFSQAMAFRWTDLLPPMLSNGRQDREMLPVKTIMAFAFSPDNL